MARPKWVIPFLAVFIAAMLAYSYAVLTDMISLQTGQFVDPTTARIVLVVLLVITFIFWYRAQSTS